MADVCYRVATDMDIPFISRTYDRNIAALHGAHRTHGIWQKLLLDPNTIYYIVYTTVPVAWFRIDLSDDMLWLGMLQVEPAYQRKGIGKYILSVAEDITREKGMQRIGIHTTEDNLAARALYASGSYEVTEVGPCTTADGVDRVGYTFQKEIKSF